MSFPVSNDGLVNVRNWGAAGLAIVVFATFGAGHASALGGAGGSGNGPGTPTGGTGTPIGGPGTVCWSADGGFDGGASICPAAGGKCMVAGQVPIDNNTSLDWAQEGNPTPWGPSSGWKCGTPGGGAAPVPFAWPSFKAAALTATPDGQVMPATPGSHIVVFDTQTAALNNCPLAAVVPGRVTTPYAPTPPAPALGSTPDYVVSQIPGLPPGCADALTINGQNAGYSFRLREINVAVAAGGCPASAPYAWNWAAGSPSPLLRASVCGGRTSSYRYSHVVDAPGVATSAEVRWMPYCEGAVTTNATGTTTFFPLRAGSQTANGISLNCDSGPNVQRFKPDQARLVYQIEGVSAES